MYLTKETKAEIFKKHGGSETNTGSTEGQIALFTFCINHLTEHLRRKKKMKVEKENMGIKDEEKIKKLKSFLEEYLNLKGVNTNKFMRCFSETHEDKHPSMSFYRRANVCKCFACGKIYNIFELVGQEYGLKTFKEQVEKAEELYNNRGLIKDINVIYSQKGISAELDYAREKKVEKELIDTYGEKVFYFYECKKRMENCDYLERRGISKKVIDYHNIGYDPNFKEGKMKFPMQVIIFPTSKSSYTARNINEKSNFRYIKVGEASMFNYWELEKNKTEPFYIVEGEIDALSLAEVNRKAISLGSITDINSREIGRASCRERV